MFECIRARIALAILCFFGFINLYLIRFSFSIIAVAMITPYDEQQRKGLCEENKDCINSENNTSNTLDWDERQKASSLGMFNYGYTITQIIGGRLSEMYGPKWFYGSAVILPAFFTFFIPIAAKSSFWAIVVIRFIQGLLQGICWPSMYVIVANWYPLNERSRFIGIIGLGATFGMVFIFPLTGFLTDYFSWEIACYIIGAIPIIWGIFWSLLMHDMPKYHPRISEKEKAFLEKALKEAGKTDKKERKVPWKSILTSLPLIAIVVCDFGNAFGLTIYSSQVPNYLVNVYHLNFTKTGIISGLPFLCRYIGSCVFSSTADYLITKEIFTVRTVRRIFSVIAMLFPPVLILIVGLQLLKSVNEFLGVICLGLFFNGAIAASQLVNCVDIAPNYAGTLFGISNTVSSAATFLSLLISGEILNSKGEIHDLWSYVFFTAVPVTVLSEVFYFIFLRGEPQPWNFYDSEPLEAPKVYGTSGPSKKGSKTSNSNQITSEHL